MENSFLSLLIVSVLLTGTIVQLVVSNIYDPSRKYAGYQKRNILHLERNAELRVLSCVLRQDDALAAIKLLEAYNPSKESPLSVHVLHLEELVGRATPLIIDHQLGQKSSSNSSPSGLRAQHIIDVFNYYKHQNLGSVSVQVFTAVSPFLFMHDDVCSLAFDKSASLVLLPFHRKWSAKGNLILDDTILRSINCQVLEKAPCSVGILVDRRKMCGSSSASNISMRSVFRMAMLFMGGDDDREALVLSKRMARSPLVHLSVVRLVSKEAKLEDRWERMLDAETLKEVQIRSPLNANITYLEHKVKEGPETAQIARSMENKFDLIILGRRHKIDSPFTTGLTEWSEFPELGPIGDLLASSDIQSGVSVLVVQQQQLQCD
ncbi:cation/H(+) antiporter 4-like [Malania oleifera]|uniref:cation/H(+) antiporter 4-like n=1 Tax=Malania oleifera TaxID=397392 RepID=UPI0025ADF101|nr:cation/H(+) antiporter 4-like [Malania oleifera]